MSPNLFRFFFVVGKWTKYNERDYGLRGGNGGHIVYGKECGR